MKARKEVIGDCELWLGDCREVLPTLKRIDVVVTDPPYGINYRSGYATASLWAAGDSIIGDVSISLRDEVLAEWAGCSVPRLVFGSRRVRPPKETRMVLVWDKGPALGMGALDLPWKPSSEEIYVLGSRFVGSRDESNVLYCPPVQSMAKNGRLHPNQKPVVLIERLLQKCPAGVVFDPFMGSCSVGVACLQLGRRFIGIEIDETYFNIACRRIEAATRQGDMLRDVLPRPTQATLPLGDAP